MSRSISKQTLAPFDQTHTLVRCFHCNLEEMWTSPSLPLLNCLQGGQLLQEWNNLIFHGLLLRIYYSESQVMETGSLGNLNFTLTVVQKELLGLDNLMLKYLQNQFLVFSVLTSMMALHGIRHLETDLILRAFHYGLLG